MCKICINTNTLVGQCALIHTCFGNSQDVRYMEHVRQYGTMQISQIAYFLAISVSEDDVDALKTCLTHSTCLLTTERLYFYCYSFCLF